MATWIIGGILVMVVGAIVWKMMKDKREGLRLRRRLRPLQGLPLSPRNHYLPEEASNNPSLRG